MLSADKQNLLSSFLGQLPAELSERLAKAVEFDRQRGGSDLPHEAILNSLRSRRQMTPGTGVPTPKRIFCLPFEDILVNVARETKQRGRIARASIDPVWNWLERDLQPAKVDEISTAIMLAALKGDLVGLDRLSADLWQLAAAALKPMLDNPTKIATAAKTLGSASAAEDAAEMALVLTGAAQLAPLTRRLPKPIAVLTEDSVDFVREIFDRLTLSNPDLAPYVLLLVMGRLEKPWEALRLTASLSRKSNDTLISSTDVGVVGELLFSDLDHYVQKIESARPMNFDSESLVADLGKFTELSSGMVKELGIRREGKWGQHLAKDRTAVALVFEDLLERAPKEILAALPNAKFGGSGKGPKSLDLMHPPDPDRLARAKRYAYLISHSRKFAAAASFHVKLLDTTENVQTMLRTYGENILREIRATPAPHPPSVDAHFSAILQLCTLALGAEETDLLRRRSRVGTAA